MPEPNLPPQLRYERLPGESETDSSLRMAKIQAEAAEERAKAADARSEDHPLAKFRRVWRS
jgi:hypothetical protein